MQPHYHNFSKYGPVDTGLGCGNHFAGTVTIDDGIGRIFAAILEDGGNITGGAAGEVIGILEAAASSIVDDSETVTVQMVSEVVGSSHIGKALSKIKDELGTICPAHQYLIDDDDNQRLMDVTPFRTQDWGMPPLNTDWCQIMTTPREIMFESIDTAFITAIVVFVSAFVGFLGAVTLLVLSLALAYRTN